MKIADCTFFATAKVKRERIEQGITCSVNLSCQENMRDKASQVLGTLEEFKTFSILGSVS